MTAVAVASSSQLAADAGAAVAAAGGNAIDAAIAACLTSMTTEPGVCSLGASGYITIWPRSGSPVTIDGYADMPGIGLNQPADPAAAWPIELSYAFRPAPMEGSRRAGARHRGIRFPHAVQLPALP
jgi:gamma-glutamyltranspeptidase/glutathione hydrolase